MNWYWVSLSCEHANITIPATYHRKNFILAVHLSKINLLMEVTDTDGNQGDREQSTQ